MEQSWDNLLTVLKGLRLRKDTHDSCFYVGKSKKPIGAHRAILAEHSEVFFAMFYGPQHESNPMKIFVPDLEPDVFNALLQFVYTGQPEITPDTAYALLYAAKKYMLTNLTDICIQWLTQHLDDDMVCCLLLSFCSSFLMRNSAASC